MTTAELAAISGIKEKTVNKRIWSVAGVTKSEDGSVVIPPGSRYPYDVHRYKFNNINKRRIALLDAIYKYRYVDHTSLKMSEESFKKMLEELLKTGLIQENGSENQYGANRFDTTIKYDELLSKSKYRMIKAISDIVGSAVGHGTGALINELTS